MFKLLAPLTLLALALGAQAGITQKDFTGIGRIAVIASSDWATANPKSKVGCLSTRGRLVTEDSREGCGVFSRLDDYPYTLSTKAGNCSFSDESQEKNTDSYYGKSDLAWSCVKGYKTEIYDELYTIDGFPYVFLCFGDIACYYDAKHIPKANESLPLWQYRWGSQQMGITPGHVQLQLIWEKIADKPKREGQSHIPSPRLEIQEGLQIPLQGGQARA